MFKHRFFKIAGIIIAFLGLVISLGFIRKSQNEQVCDEIAVSVDYSDNLFFVDEKDIQKTLSTSFDSIKGQKMSTLNLSSIEKAVLKNQLIADAKVYKSVDGKLNVEVKQRKPMVRVFSENGFSFYIDKNENFMPLSRKYTSDVLVASGHFPTPQHPDSLFNDSIYYQLVELVDFINEDEFWKAQIQQIYLTGNHEFELIPRVGSHTILIGSVENLEEKLNNLFILYKNGLNKLGWNQYSYINLKFKDQIVCTKK